MPLGALGTGPPYAVGSRGGGRARVHLPTPLLHWRVLGVPAWYPVISVVIALAVVPPVVRGVVRSPLLLVGRSAPTRASPLDSVVSAPVVVVIIGWAEGRTILGRPALATAPIAAAVAAAVIVAIVPSDVAIIPRSPQTLQRSALAPAPLVTISAVIVPALPPAVPVIPRSRRAG